MPEQESLDIKYIPAPEGLEELHDAGIEVSKGPYYEALHSGQIPSIRIGRRFYVRADLVVFLQGKKV